MTRRPGVLLGGLKYPTDVCLSGLLVTNVTRSPCRRVPDPPLSLSLSESLSDRSAVIAEESDENFRGGIDRRRGKGGVFQRPGEKETVTRAEILDLEIRPEFETRVIYENYPLASAVFAGKYS